MLKEINFNEIPEYILEALKTDANMVKKFIKLMNPKHRALVKYAHGTQLDLDVVAYEMLVAVPSTDEVLDEITEDQTKYFLWGDGNFVYYIDGDR